MPENQISHLPNLVWLRLVSSRLEREDLTNSCLREDVVTPTNTFQKAEILQYGP